MKYLTRTAFIRGRTDHFVADVTYAQFPIRCNENVNL